VGAWGAPFFRGLKELWSKRDLLGGTLASPIRLVRFLRRHKIPQAPPKIEP